MNHYFVTGTGSGIGYELACELLKNSENKVWGISRKNTISDPNFHFFNINLSELSAVTSFQFPEITDAEKVVLINNAGTLSTAKHIGKVADEDIINTFNVNLLAPALLTNKFIQVYGKIPAEKCILNISSGAGKYPIDGWSAYCASKAGLDMFTRVANEELKVKQKQNILHLSVAPGVVDTSMQSKIRESDPSQFSRIKDFLNYKSQKQLANPKEIALKLIRLINNPSVLNNEQVVSLKDFEL